MINFGPIETNIYIGNAPQTAVDVSRLNQMAVTAVLSLQSDQDFKNYRIDIDELQNAYNANNILFQRFPIIDFDEQDLGRNLTQPVHELNRLFEAKHRVYVHCNAGVCRAPATVLAYLCHYRGMDIKQGLAYIRENRPQANPYISAVLKALQELAQAQ